MDKTNSSSHCNNLQDTVIALTDATCSKQCHSHKHIQEQVLLRGQYMDELIVATSIKDFLIRDIPQMNLRHRQTSGNCWHPGRLNCSCATVC